MAFQISNAQVHGVWGSLREAKPQKTGETYIGLMKGSGSATGVSGLIHLSEKLGLHVFYGLDMDKYNDSKSFIHQDKLYGFGLQPRINFRNKNLNAAYYLNLSVVGGNNRMRYLENTPSSKTVMNRPRPTVIRTEGVVGVGAFFEVYKKYQIFAERNYEIGYKNGTNYYIGSGWWQCNVGVRISIM